MLSKRVVLVLVALCCLFAFAPSAVMGQAASSGTVAGTVTDPTGAAVVGATVTLTDPTVTGSRHARQPTNRGASSSRTSRQELIT